MHGGGEDWLDDPWSWLTWWILLRFAYAGCDDGGAGSEYGGGGYS